MRNCVGKKTKTFISQAFDLGKVKERTRQDKRQDKTRQEIGTYR